LEGIRIALVQEKLSGKVEVMVEEMHAKKNQVFLFAGFGGIYAKLSKSKATV